MKPPGPERSTILLHIAFRAYRKRVRDIWESYSLIDHYGKVLHSLLKKGVVDPIDLTPLMVGSPRKQKIDDAQGALNHLRLKANPRRTLIDCVGEFENYLSQVLFLLFRDIPGKMGKSIAPSTEAADLKLITIILESQDKDEILERIAEERIRGMFYGKPSDIFTSGKVFPEFGSYFKDNYNDVLDLYGEITARRNLLVHQAGKVDRKYMREVKNPILKLKQTVPLPTTYLKNSLSILEGLAAIATQLIVIRVYKETAQGKLIRSVQSFHQLLGKTQKPILPL